MTREELLRHAQALYEFSLTPENIKSALQEEFPELRESEDERIRKEMTIALTNCLDELIENGGWKYVYVNDKNIPIKEVKKWLEKQKEQKSLNISAASEWLREHISRYMNSEYNEFHKCVEYDGSIDKERLINDFEEAMQKEQKPIKVYDNMDDLIADAMIDEISKSDTSDSDKHNRIYWINKHRQNLAEWSEDDKGALEDAICAADMLGNDESFNKGNPNLAKAFRVAKDRLKSFPERFNLQPMNEWSEEDEKMLASFLHKVEVCDLLTNKENVWIIKRLKALRPQPHTVSTKDATKFGNLEYERGVKDGIQNEKSRQWKPSKKQMKALEASCSALKTHETWGEDEHLPILMSLINDLQKLL